MNLIYLLLDLFIILICVLNIICIPRVNKLICKYLFIYQCDSTNKIHNLNEGLYIHVLTN